MNGHQGLSRARPIKLKDPQWSRLPVLNLEFVFFFVFTVFLIKKFLRSNIQKMLQKSVWNSKIFFFHNRGWDNVKEVGKSYLYECLFLLSETSALKVGLAALKLFKNLHWNIFESYLPNYFIVITTWWRSFTNREWIVTNRDKCYELVCKTKLYLLGIKHKFAFCVLCKNYLQNDDCKCSFSGIFKGLMVYTSDTFILEYMFAYKSILVRINIFPKEILQLCN